ncbi:hypothetical protein BC940DRAFT_338259 [Gongronella butleri]|nr:hypothetical protein BC940DRAFT_338259 [Gongronella butleri]
MLSISLALLLLGGSQASSFVYEDFLAHPRYRLELTENKIPESQALTIDSHWKHHEKDASNQVTMMTASGQPFLCTIPALPKSSPAREQKKPPNPTQQDLQSTIERGLDLLKPLDSQCLYLQTHGYWTYEYCHRKHVRQFHIDPMKTDMNDKYVVDPRTSYILGHYEQQADRQQAAVTLVAPVDKHGILYGNSLNPFIEKGAENENESPAKATVSTHLRQVGDKRLLVQRWRDGTLCDITQQPRTIDIQYQCDRQSKDFIATFEEVSTCHYLMTISTPRLCDDQLLSDKNEDDAHTIECNPIVPEHWLLDQHPAPPKKDDDDAPIVEHQQPPTDQKDTKTPLPKDEAVPQQQPEKAKEPAQETKAAKEESQKDDDIVYNENEPLSEVVQRLTKQVAKLQEQLDRQQQQKTQEQQQQAMLDTQIYFVDQAGQMLGRSSQAASAEVQALLQQLMPGAQQAAKRAKTAQFHDGRSDSKHASTASTASTSEKEHHQQQNKKAYEKNYYAKAPQPQQQP